MSDVVTIGSEQVNDTEREKQEKRNEAAEQVAEDFIRARFRTPFLQVLNETKKGKTLKDIIQEVEEKRSNMTRIAREFVLNFKENRIQEWIDTEDDYIKRITERNNKIRNGRKR